MPVRDLIWFLPTAEDVLACDLPKLGEILLMHLNSWKDERKVWQPVGGWNRLYFEQVMEGTERGLGPARRSGPEYGARQPEVTRKMRETWNWLERQGLLMHNPEQPQSPDSFVITSMGEELLARLALAEEADKLLGWLFTQSNLHPHRERIPAGVMRTPRAGPFNETNSGSPQYRRSDFPLSALMIQSP